MTAGLRVCNVVFSPASTSDRRAGLLGYLRFQVCGGLLIDGVTLRRTQAGELRLAYPRRGGELYVVRPMDEETRRDLERQVFDVLGLDGGGAR